MKYILIRDDDITPFTRRDMLEKLYEDFFNAGLPVNLSLIPQVSTDIHFDADSPYSPYKHLMDIKYSPMIPPKYRGEDIKAGFEENQGLLDMVNGLGENVEILVHGFDHDHKGKRNEFAVYDYKTIDSKLADGRTVIKKLFNTEPKFFVAPSDSISFVTLKALKQQGFKGISLWHFDALKSALGEIKRRFSAAIISENLKVLLKLKKIKDNIFQWDDFLVVEHPGYIFSRFASPGDIEKDFLNVLNTNEIIIIVNHYWEYFFDWNGLDEEYFRTWKKMIGLLLERDDCRFMTFSQLYGHLNI